MNCPKRNGVICETPSVCAGGCRYNNDPIHPNRTEIYNGPIGDLIDGPEAFVDGMKAGLAKAAKLLDVSADTIRLHAGEMTAQEMRSVRAVLKWKKREIENLINGG